ncbi:MAG TPA: hypothetical protein VFH39_03090 [Candidatus Saccharimonadales bacterium]|nr:hypothetical protein [Candidatus Saccharimonadales bacterium]
MTAHTERITRETTPDDRVIERREIEHEVPGDAYTSGRTNLAQRIIWFLAGILLLLLVFRFVLALLGANPSNWFANFIYTTSHPFVAPFFGLFGYHLQYGVSRFEIYTLVAIAVYVVIAWGLDRLVTIHRPRTY